MRIAACLLLAALNALLAAALTSIAFDADTSLLMKFGFGAAALAVWLASGLLAGRPFTELPAAAVALFRGWCITFPALYFIASMDSGMLSGQEFFLGLFVAGFSWATWRAFIWAKRPGRPAEQASA